MQSGKQKEVGKGLNEHIEILCLQHYVCGNCVYMYTQM